MWSCRETMRLGPAVVERVTDTEGQKGAQIHVLI